MKRLLIGLVLFVLLATAGTCQDVLYRTEATLQWDTVTTDTDGEPFLPTDVVEYEVYIYDYIAGVTNPQSTSELTYMGLTATTELLIVFPHRTTWAAGVRVKLTDAGSNVTYSTLSWSYIAGDAPSPFVYAPSGSPTKPAVLRDSGT